MRKKINNLLLKWAPTLAAKRGGFGEGSWGTFLGQMDKEYPLTPAEKEYYAIYLKQAPRLSNGEPQPFDDWLLNYLVSSFGDQKGNELFNNHVAFRIARGQYVEEQFQKLSASQRKSAQDYVSKNAVGNKNRILSDYLFKQKNFVFLD